MLRIFTSVLFALIAIFVSAQGSPGGGTPGGRATSGKIKGRIYNQTDKTPLPYASVMLYTAQKDSLITGAISSENGYFTLTNIPLASYKLKVISMGFDSLVKMVHLNFSTQELEIGNLYVSPSVQMLQAVSITAEKAQIELKPDKRIINVDKDISARGGTALDALQNAPGVTVGADDEISLRNSSPIIYVDGKPTQLSMRQIPADQINTIEIITNPSAKYEASATGGIINITLKKDKKPGYNGMLNGGIGSNNQYNGMGMFNLKESKWLTNISYNFNSGRNIAPLFSYRDNFLNGEYNGGNYQEGTSVFERQFQFARLNFDYFLNNRNTISISQNAMEGKLGFDENHFIDQLADDRELISKSDRINDQNVNFSNYTTTLSFRHTFPKQGKEYTADFSYSASQGKGDSNNKTNNYDNVGNPIDNGELQLIQGTTQGRILTAHFDFTNPITETAKLEFGLRSNWENKNSNQSVKELHYPSGEFLNDPNLSNKYNINDIVSAAYISYSSKLGKLNYQTGLRLESSNFFTTYNDTNKFSYNYPSSIKDFTYALFPNVNLSYPVSEKQQLQFNVSRKITRPNMFQSAPFIFSADKFNLRIGNPFIRPEFVNILELNHNYRTKGINLLSSFYGKYHQNTISPYAYFADSTNTILINSYENAEYSYSYGFEPNLAFTKIKNLNINLSANLFYIYTGSIAGKSAANDGMSWNSKATISYRFPKDLSIQLIGNYEAPRPIPQGRILEVYGADLSLSKTVKNWTVSFTLNDIFNTRRIQMEYIQQDYYQITSRRRDIRFVRLNLTYRFGKMDASFFRPKKSRDSNQQPVNSIDGY
ncbi:MAG: TonB-dependent receptor [Bacteroidota bacterium]|nr:TonB-dependent receptor [Bacteroidota bacterium]